VTGTTNGCTGTASVTVTVLPLPVADATPSVLTGYPPLAVTFTNNSTDATSYLWSFGTGATSTAVNPNPTFNTPGTYQITLVASNGVCDSTWSDSIIVIPYPAMTIQVPNVFSPNGDNSNEEYVITIVNGKVFHATILNRWGNVMFETDVLNAGWNGKIDGKDADEGVYFVKYHAEGLDETVQEGHTFFHLVR
jgi:gliding motility-associated-like protein